MTGKINTRTTKWLGVILGGAILLTLYSIAWALVLPHPWDGLATVGTLAIIGARTMAHIDYWFDRWFADHRADG